MWLLERERDTIFFLPGGIWRATTIGRRGQRDATATQTHSNTMGGSGKKKRSGHGGFPLQETGYPRTGEKEFPFASPLFFFG